MQRYFVESIKDDLFILNKEDSYHIIKVMRAKIKDKIEIVYQKECFVCEIINTDNLVKTKILEKKKSDFLLPNVTVAQSLIREQKIDYMIQKTVELGITTIIPLKTVRSIINIDKKETEKITRWQKIAKEASEQSKRLEIAKIEKIHTINDLIQKNYDYKILLTVNETSNNIKRILSNITINDKILVVVGPEGGFTKEEEKTLLDYGFIGATLGNLVLRSETVAITIMSIINYILMR